MELPKGKLLLVKDCGGVGWEGRYGCLDEPHPWVVRKGSPNPADWKWYWCLGKTE